MAASVVDLGQRIILWAMGTLASMHAFANALQWFMSGNGMYVAIWSTTGVLAFMVGFQAERVKMFLEEFGR